MDVSSFVVGPLFKQLTTSPEKVARKQLFSFYDTTGNLITCSKVFFFEGFFYSVCASIVS